VLTKICACGAIIQLEQEKSGSIVKLTLRHDSPFGGPKPRCAAFVEMLRKAKENASKKSRYDGEGRSDYLAAVTYSRHTPTAKSDGTSLS
jgi:hypothetical protein